MQGHDEASFTSAGSFSKPGSFRTSSEESGKGRTGFEWFCLKKIHQPFAVLQRSQGLLYPPLPCPPNPVHQDLNTCTARTTYCLQMGHSLMRLPHLLQVTMWPHSSRTQSMGESMQMRHRFSSRLLGAADSGRETDRDRQAFSSFKCCQCNP